MNGWEPALWVLERDSRKIRFVVQTGRQTNCGGIARITVRAERAVLTSAIVDSAPREATRAHREAAMTALGKHLQAEAGLLVTIEDDYDHPVDLSEAKFADAGHVAGAFLGAWARSPDASDEALVSTAWSEEADRWRRLHPG